MTIVAATEFARNFDRYREAAQHEAVAVKSHARISGYFVSVREFAEYRRLKAMASVAPSANELSDETLEALAAAHMDQRHHSLDAPMD